MSKNVAILAVFVLTFAPRASAQVTHGETSLNLNGTVSAGYSDVYTNFSASDHSVVFGGAADLSGSYYNPSFLSFDIQPFYNQSRDNSTSQSLTASSGVNASTQLFGGSHFPGSISYSTSFNSSGNFNVPGLANYTTHGDNDVLAVNWGVHLKDLPSLDFSFSNSNNAYSIYGTNAQGTLHSDLFSVRSGYEVAGFTLNGGYQHSALQTLTPEFLTGEPAQNSNSGVDSFSFGVGHKLPWNGSISAAASHINISTDVGDTTSGESYSTSMDTLSGGISFAPRTHLNVGGSTYYTDNLEGTLYNTLLTSGVSVPQNEGQPSSHDLSLTGYANYEMPAQHLDLNAFLERQQQTYLGISLASDSYNGTATYFNTLLGGSFNGVLGVTRTSIDTTHQSLLGLNGSVNYTHQIHRWTMGGGFSYSQDTQTVLIAYTTSGYNYSASLGRRIGRRSYWGAYASGTKSLLTDQPNSANSSQSYSTSLSVAQYSISGAFSESRGNALLTSTGLVTTSVPLPAINPAAVVFYNGKSFSAGLGAHPTRGLTLSASFAKALSDTQSSATNSNNNNENLNVFMTYYLRKVSLVAGYSRLVQGFSVSGTPPTMVGSFYVGVTRWFNFF